MKLYPAMYNDAFCGVTPTPSPPSMPISSSRSCTSPYLVGLRTDTDTSDMEFKPIGTTPGFSSKNIAIFF